ncbi:hypothetical protein [Endozoicomonas ascidiicola]|uniref:hypothetical protein n=1 Tax=Endozoicomonas ascidiicola TaxID=1698521 RepID=UPI00082A4849|nr:hypothetical protein [Endozoicomonas ascidiicola]
MMDFPKLVYIEMNQVVPDLEMPETLEVSVPVIMWHGRKIEIRQAVLEYARLVSPDVKSREQQTLKQVFQKVIGVIQKSHPDYFRRCMAQD